MDYEAGHTVTFVSGDLNDLSALGGCYQTIMRTRKVKISWSGPEGSTWVPGVVTIEENGGYQRICKPTGGTKLNNKDDPVIVNCPELDRK